MFLLARLKLTAWYSLIIMFVSVMFSVVIYQVLVNEVIHFENEQRFRIEQQLQENGCVSIDGRSTRLPPRLPEYEELVEEAKHRVLFSLTLVNLGVLGLSAGLGYLLAGRTLKPIKKMMEEQNQFISDASHELKTPLTSLKSAFEVYLRSKNRTIRDADQVISESIEEVNKLQSLSESLLQLAQYQKPNGHTRFERISVSALTQEALKKVEPLAKKKKITIKEEIVETDVLGNKYSLVDLLVILLDNAIKYSQPKEEITVSTKQKESSLEITIKDQGVGIEKKDLPHIFDRFYRSDKARSRETTGGYGLGLSIAQKIVALHHGTISVRSVFGKGTTFTIHLPHKKSKKIL
jgi:signal transduction histidine kinase